MNNALGRSKYALKAQRRSKLNRSLGLPSNYPLLLAEQVTEIGAENFQIIATPINWDKLTQIEYCVCGHTKTNHGKKGECQVGAEFGKECHCEKYRKVDINQIRKRINRMLNRAAAGSQAARQSSQPQGTSSAPPGTNNTSSGFTPTKRALMWRIG